MSFRAIAAPTLTFCAILYGMNGKGRPWDMVSIVKTEFERPPTGQVVARLDHCPCFEARKRLLPSDDICWFCRYAEYDLSSRALPETGLCKYPETQTE